MAWSADRTHTDFDHYSDVDAGLATYASDDDTGTVLQTFTYCAIDYGPGNEKTIKRMRLWLVNAAAYGTFIADGNEYFQGSNNSTDGTDGDWDTLITFKDLREWNISYPEWGKWLYVLSPAAYRWYRVANINFITNAVLAEWEMQEETGAAAGSGITSIDSVAIADVAVRNSVAIADISTINGIAASSADIRMLVHSDTVDGDTEFYDDGPTHHNILVGGNAHHSDDVSEFCATSLKFDGSGDYGKVPQHSDFTFGSDSFSIDFWWYATGNSDERDGLVCFNTPAGNPNIHIGLGGHVTNWGVGGNLICLSLSYTGSWLYQGICSTNVCDSDFHNIRLVRSGTSFKVYIDGVAEITTTQTYSVPASEVIIGAHIITDRWAVGYIDELYVVGGALNAGNFTPETDPWGGYSCV